jgi:hypothetical protein
MLDFENYCTWMPHISHFLSPNRWTSGPKVHQHWRYHSPHFPHLLWLHFSQTDAKTQFILPHYLNQYFTTARGKVEGKYVRHQKSGFGLVRSSKSRTFLGMTSWTFDWLKDTSQHVTYYASQLCLLIWRGSLEKLWVILIWTRLCMWMLNADGEVRRKNLCQNGLGNLNGTEK